MAAASSDWNPHFNDDRVSVIRRVGGFYRTLAATTFDQHRSNEGPTFRLACGEGLSARLLLGIPPLAEPVYQGVLVGLINYRQTSFEVNGVLGVAHHLALGSGREHVLDVRTPPLRDGIHRFVLVLFDADQNPGFYGAHDLWADLYVGASPTLEPIPLPRSLPSRTDSVIRGTHYGLSLTSVGDSLRLVGTKEWRAELTLFVSFWGSVREGERPVVLTILQDFRQMEIQGAGSSFVALPERVSVLSFRPKPLGRQTEPVRVLMFTNPHLEMAPEGTYQRQHSFRAYASQKAYLVRPSSD